MITEPIVLARAEPIGPPGGRPWPGKRQAPLYWLAQKRFDLPAPAGAARIMMAADRHYEVYVNGQLAARQRNFFSGDEYLFVQMWDRQITPLLRPGANTLDVVIRSDPWRNKNHRCYQPVLLLAGTFACGDRQVEVASDSSWQVAEIDGWREQIAIGGNGTIHFERVTLPPADRAVLAGFDQDLRFQTARRPDPAAPLPKLRLWNDPPKRLDTLRPGRIAARGPCRLPARALVFDLAEWPGGAAPAFEAVFRGAGRQTVHLSA